MIEISKKDFSRYTQHLPPALWLWAPIGFAIMQLLIETVVPHELASSWHEENGLLEMLHTGVIFVALIYGLITIPSVLKLNNLFLRVWLFIACIGCLYITGEEVSWGQHIFGWESGEFWQSVNDQQETNLHNTSSWLDQKPRILVEIGIIVGGLIIPALIKWAPHKLPKPFWIIYPNAQYAVTAVIFLIFKLLDRLPSIAGESPFIRGSEVLELFMFYFIFIYMVDFHKRMSKEPARQNIIHNP